MPLLRAGLALILLCGPVFAARRDAPAPPALPRSAVPALERARPSDLGAIMAIERTSFSPEERWDKRSWAQTLADPEQTVLVVRDAGRAAAAIAYDRREDAENDRLYILTVGVHPDHRKRGYGEALMRAAMDEAQRDPSLKGASLHVRVDNEGAQKLYRKLGFRTLERIPRYYEELGIDAFYMAWDKAPAEQEVDASRLTPR